MAECVNTKTGAHTLPYLFTPNKLVLALNVSIVKNGVLIYITRCTRCLRVDERASVIIIITKQTHSYPCVGVRIVMTGRGFARLLLHAYFRTHVGKLHFPHNHNTCGRKCPCVQHTHTHISCRRVSPPQLLWNNVHSGHIIGDFAICHLLLPWWLTRPGYCK